jgi:hypothetical protein
LENLTTDFPDLLIVEGCIICDFFFISSISEICGEICSAYISTSEIGINSALFLACSASLRFADIIKSKRQGGESVEAFRGGNLIPPFLKHKDLLSVASWR